MCFLKLFQPEDFLLDGCDPPFWFSKDDSFVNHFVKIRVPDIFDPSIFLKSTSQPNQGDTDDTNFLLESNINTLEAGTEKSNGNSFLDSSKPVDPIDQEQIQSIINKNIEYLKNDDIPSLSAEPSKVASPFHQSQGLPRLLSPIDKHLHLFGDGSKSRLHSPFEKSAGFLQDGQVGYSSGSFMYSSNPSLPFSCGLSTDLFSSIQIPQDENPHGYQTNIEEFPTLKYLDLAKKDPFFGQNPGFSQMNTKDPFLINAAFKATEKPSCSLQKSQITRSCEDLQSSPMLPIQDGNYFNFPSTLDEPTQLDYLDLATLDFLTNPNLISYGMGVFKEKLYERDDDIYSEGYLTDQEQCGVKSETAARLDAISVSDNGDISAFSKVKKKQLRLKKSKSDIGKRHDNTTPGNKSFFGGFSDVRDDFQQSANKSSDNLNSVHPKRSRSLIESSDYRIGRKRKLDTPKECSSETKLLKMNRKSSELKKISRSEKTFNEEEKLSHLTQEQKDSMKAVIGQSGCIFVKKKRSLSCDEPVVYVNDVQVFGVTDLFDGQNKNKGREDKHRLGLSYSKENFNEKCKSGKLTSVLQLKCLECDFRCRSVVELKNHRVIHTKKTEMAPLLVRQTNTPQTTVSCIKNQTTSEMKPEDINSSVIEIKGSADTDNVSHLHCSISTALTCDKNSSVLSQADNTVPSSVPVTEKCLSVFDNSVIICEATKEFVASQPKTVSLLPRKITEISLHHSNCPLEKASTESFCNSINFVEPYSADMSKETAIAVQTIEDINSKYETSDDTEQKDACLSDRAEPDTVNMVEKSGNDSNQKNEMYVLDREFRGAPIQNDKMDFDFEFTPVPLQTYRTDVLLLDKGQISAETATEDFIRKTITGKDIKEISEGPDKLVRKFGSEHNHLKQDLLFFEESKTAECLIKVAEEKEESAKTELTNPDYLNTDRPGTHLKQIKVNVCVEKRSGNVKCLDSEEISENSKNDQVLSALAVKDDCMHDYTKDINKLEKVLGASTGKISVECQADDHSEDYVERDYSETPHPNQFDARPKERIAQINGDTVENTNLKDDNCWTTFVRTFAFDDIKECIHGQELPASVVNEKSDTFNHFEKKSDFKVLNMDQNPPLKGNGKHFKASLSSDKEGSNLASVGKNLFKDPAIFDISSGKTGNKSVLLPRISQQLQISALDLSEPRSSKEFKHLKNENAKLRYFTDSVVNQNEYVPRSNLVTKSDDGAIVSQIGIECTESVKKQRFGKPPNSETSSLGFISMSELANEGISGYGTGSNTPQGLVPEINLTDKDPYAFKHPRVQNIIQQSSSATNNLVKGRPCSEGDSENVKIEAKPDFEDNSSTMTDLKNYNTGNERQKIIEGKNVHMANSVSEMLDENLNSKDSIVAGTITVTDRSDTAEINRSQVKVTPKLGVPKMQSLLRGNTVHISNVTGQLLNTTVDPVQECGTENREFTLMKDFKHEEAEGYCKEERSDIPVLEDQTDMDSAKTEHSSKYFINKDICKEGTKNQVKAYGMFFGV